MSQKNFTLVSVVMSVFNGEEYLSESIESILNQTLKEFEFIIINDGSTDSSLKIIQKYKDIDCRIVLINRENLGLIKSLNEGLDVAKGKYIARMDADDIALDTRLEKQYHFLEKNNNIGVCGTWVEVFGEKIKSKIWKMPLSDSELKPILMFSVPFAHPSVMFRKKLVDLFSLRYEEKFSNAEDYKFWLDFSKFTEFATIPLVLLKYRYHQDSVSRLADNSKTEDRFQIISSIQYEVYSLLGMKLTDIEKRQNFIVALNERLLNHQIDLNLLYNFFCKIIEVNKNASYFNQKSLKILLSRRFFVANILSLKRDKQIHLSTIMNHLFFAGMYYTLKNKISYFLNLI